ncbi:hypothetical protein [Xenorhabdus nematophila]|uniref:hypothetical protein n=1 Tax=Xenorhabdus nematophila TaxID=628 RepID=UPI0012DD96DC|nr:hypothetical protein [Xenorhabdus nematophila]
MNNLTSIKIGTPLPQHIAFAVIEITKCGRGKHLQQNVATVPNRVLVGHHIGTTSLLLPHDVLQQKNATFGLALLPYEKLWMCNRKNLYRAVILLWI